MVWGEASTNTLFSKMVINSGLGLGLGLGLKLYGYRTRIGARVTVE